MSCWDVLCIEITNEKTIIKKAYAKQLKLHHPEDDPEGYQRLREAYDTALKYAKNANTYSVDQNGKREQYTSYDNNSSINNNLFKPYEDHDYYTEPPAGNQRDIVPVNLYEQNNVYEEQPEDTHRTIIPVDLADDIAIEEISNEEYLNQFSTQLMNLYNDFFQRIEIKNWQELFTCDIMWKVDYKNIISKIVLQFLIKHHQLPDEVWKLINQIFEYSEQKDELFKAYPKEEINPIIKNIESSKALNFCYFEKAEGVDYEEYLNYREKAYEAIESYKYTAAKKYLDSAKAIYNKKDPDLLRMYGIYYLHLNNKSDAYDCLKHAVEINPKDYSAHYYLAKIYNRKHDNKELEEVNCIYSHYLEEAQDTNILSFIGSCYFKYNEFGKAMKIFKLILKREPKNGYARNYLLKILPKLNIEASKYPKNKYLKSELDDLFKLLRIPKITQYIYKLGRIHLKTYAAAIILNFVFILCLLAALFNHQGLNMCYQNVYNYFINQNKNAIEIKNSSELVNINHNELVHVKITQAEWMCIYQLDVDNTIKYVNSDELDKEHLNEYINGYVFTGILGTERIIFLTTYEQTANIDKTNSMDFYGNVYNLNSTQLVSLVYDTNRKYKMKYQLTDNLFSTKYLDVKLKKDSTKDNINTAILLFGFFELILSLYFVLFLINNLYEKFRHIKYNFEV